MRKDILFLCQFFYPEHNSSATLPFDTAVYLASVGYTVDALCGFPKEYADAKDTPLREEADRVGIRRLRYLQLSRTGKLGRLINYFSFTMAVLLHLHLLKRYRAVIVYSNPPVLPLAAVLANALFHTKIVFVAYDIYPEVAYASRSLQPGGVIDKAMRCINRQLYRRASAVIALTEEMKQFILGNREQTDASRIFVIPNWAHEQCRKPAESDYARFGYRQDQLIVAYFGNMGTCQDVETMIGAMQQLQDREDIQFLVVGHGNKKDDVIRRTAAYKNVRVMDFLTGDDFEAANAIASCGIVSLEKGLKGMCAPSKFYSYLQSGCAVLTVTEADSYLAQETECEKIGYAINIGDSEKLAQIILNLYENPECLHAMQQAAGTLYQQKYAYPVAMQQYQTAIREVLDH